jgi:hypothetical protein
MRVVFRFTNRPGALGQRRLVDPRSRGVSLVPCGLCRLRVGHGDLEAFLLKIAAFVSQSEHLSVNGTHPLPVQFLVPLPDFTQSAFALAATAGGELYVDGSPIQIGTMQLEGLLQRVTVGEFEEGKAFGFGARLSGIGCGLFRFGGEEAYCRWWI